MSGPDLKEKNMPTWLLVLLIVLGALIIIFVVLILLGRRNQKKMVAQQKELEKNAQPISFYIIDMKRLRIDKAGLPKIVVDNTPKFARMGKAPILKVKAGNKVMNLVCDNAVYKTLLPKQEVRAMVAGIYVVSAKRIRGPQVEAEKKKKKNRGESLLDRLR